jgi:hypothetical protein
VAGRAGEGGARSLGADHADLPVVDRAGVGGDQARDRLGGRHPGGQQGQSLRPVREVGIRLGGHRAHVGQGGGHGRAGPEELAGHGHAERTTVGGAGHDREGHVRTLAEL